MNRSEWIYTRGVMVIHFMLKPSISRSKHMCYRHWICLRMIYWFINFFLNNLHIRRLREGLRLGDICWSIREIMLICFIVLFLFLLLSYLFLVIPYIILNEQWRRTDLAREFLFLFWLGFAVEKLVDLLLSLFIGSFCKNELVFVIDVDER